MTRYTFTTTDQQTAERMMHSDDLCHVIHELQEALRERVKHGTDTRQFTAGVEWARGQLAELLQDNDISMERMWS